MLRPKLDSTRAMAASSCHGTPQPDSRAARSMVARWSAVSVGTNACQSRAASSVVAASCSVGSSSSDGLGSGVGDAAACGVPGAAAGCGVPGVGVVRVAAASGCGVGPAGGCGLGGVVSGRGVVAGGSLDVGGWPDTVARPEAGGWPDVDTV